MSPLTAAVSFVADHLGEPVERLDADGIQQARASVRPTNRLYTAFTGAADREVGITYGTAPARDDHEIPLRIYRPRALRDSARDVPVVMWFHGGGWVLGNVVDHDPICTLVAAGVGCVVVSVDYRMAPDHRGPVAVHDCVDATTWVGVNGDVLRADTTAMAVAGDSAGGNLAAVVAQVLRDHGDTRLRHQVADLPGDRPDDVLAVGARARERGDPHQALDGRLSRPLRAAGARPARPPPLTAVRPPRRAPARAGPDGGHRPDP